jgi:hypothetical protein
MPRPTLISALYGESADRIVYSIPLRPRLRAQAKPTLEDGTEGVPLAAGEYSGSAPLERTERNAIISRPCPQGLLCSAVGTALPRGAGS